MNNGYYTILEKELFLFKIHLLVDFGTLYRLFELMYLYKDKKLYYLVLSNNANVTVPIISQNIYSSKYPQKDVQYFYVIVKVNN